MVAVRSISSLPYTWLCGMAKFAPDNLIMGREWVHRAFKL